MSSGLLIGEDEKVAAWAFSTFHYFPMPANRCIGVVDKDKILKGAILFQNFNGINIEISYYGPNTLTVGILRAIARIVISEFNAARITVVTSKRNKHIMRFLTKFGFVFEGTQRCFYGHEDCKRNTGVRFVMFRDKILKISRIKNHA